MIQDLYLTVQGYGQKFHHYDRNMRRSRGGRWRERNPHHKCLHIMLPEGSTEGVGWQSHAGYSPQLRTSRGNTAAGTAKPARYLPQEVPHGLHTIYVANYERSEYFTRMRQVALCRKLRQKAQARKPPHAPTDAPTASSSNRRTPAPHHSESTAA